MSFQSVSKSEFNERFAHLPTQTVQLAHALDFRIRFPEPDVGWVDSEWKFGDTLIEILAQIDQILVKHFEDLISLRHCINLIEARNVD